MKIKCPYCKKFFDYSKEEVEWVPIIRMILLENLKKPSREKYVAACKNCEKKIEFWM